LTKTIFGKKLLLIATITVLVTGLTLAATFDDAEAHDEDGVQELECESIGSFYDPFPEVFSSSAGKCSAGLGKVTSAAITVVTAGVTPGCLTLTSLDKDFSVGKNGFIMFTTTGEQCFNDVDGDPLGIAFDGTFCGASVGSAYTSEVIGTYAISSGLVKDTPVDGGAGDFVSLADHCAGNTAPFGNSFTTELEGTIIFADEEEEEDEEEEDEEEDD